MALIFLRRVVRSLLGVLLALSLGLSPVVAQDAGRERTPVASSGGAIHPAQAAYNVGFYDLDVQLFPTEKRIEGQLRMQAGVTAPLTNLVLDLDTTMTVTRVERGSIEAGWQDAPFQRDGGHVIVPYPTTRQPGDTVQVRIHYNGQPRVAPNPPWDGGFTWTTTPEGQPWIGVSVQTNGADLWWPCKDHPSDEPDSMRISVRVPEPLVAAANGQSEGVEKHRDETRTYHWLVSTPINNYGVSLNVAPYRRIDATYTNTNGFTVPVRYWVLPAHYQRGQELVQKLIDYTRFFEEYFGPFPFRADKLGMAETPYLGMEHQTILAYGSNYQDNAFGFDYLLHHELAHEWWGNLVTVYDWKDFWIHEGFATYTQAMMAEEKGGMQAYHRYIEGMRPHIINETPVAPRQPQTTRDMYYVSSASGRSNQDIYYKGALILHTLRYLVGDEDFFRTLREIPYPTSTAAKATGGRQCRFVTTRDIRSAFERVTGRNLKWFFDVYLRQAPLPELRQEEVDGELHLTWVTSRGTSFPMPVPVRVSGSTRRVQMTDGSATIDVSDGATVQVDPNNWILKR